MIVSLLILQKMKKEEHNERFLLSSSPDVSYRSRKPMLIYVVNICAFDTDMQTNSIFSDLVTRWMREKYMKGAMRDPTAILAHKAYHVNSAKCSRAFLRLQNVEIHVYPYLSCISGVRAYTIPFRMNCLRFQARSESVTKVNTKNLSPQTLLACLKNRHTALNSSQ